MVIYYLFWSSLDFNAKTVSSRVTLQSHSINIRLINPSAYRRWCRFEHRNSPLLSGGNASHTGTRAGWQRCVASLCAAFCAEVAGLVPGRTKNRRRRVDTSRD